MTAQNWLKLSLLPVFAVLALGSSSPKKKDGDPAATASSSTTTTTSASKTGSVLGHCDHKGEGYCKEIYAFSFGGEASERKICDALNSSYESGTPCPTRDTLWGVCARKDVAITPDEKPGLKEKISYYDEGGNRASVGGGADVAKGACDALSGEWTLGPASLKPAPAAPAAKKPAAKKK